MDQFSESSESVQSVSEPVLLPVQYHKPLRIKVRSDHGTFDLSKFRGSVDRGPLTGGKHSFAEPDSSGFLLKGIHSLSTGSRVPAGEPFCKLVGMDWFKSKDRMDHISGRPRSLVQRACSNEGLFSFVINLQIQEAASRSDIHCKIILASPALGSEFVFIMLRHAHVFILSILIMRGKDLIHCIKQPGFILNVI